MNNEMKFEEKYKNLKAQFMESVDLAFRLGFEQGQQKAAQDQMAQQQQQAELAAAQAAQGQPGQPGAPGEDAPGGAEAQAPEGQAQANPMGSEVDQHINELEGLMGKSEMSPDDLKKAMGVIKDMKFARDLKKAQDAIHQIQAVYKPAAAPTMSKQAQHNLTSASKESLKLQTDIVNNFFKAWDEEEKTAGKSVADTLKIEGLLK